MSEEHQIQYLPPDLLRPHPLNPKHHPAKQRTAISASLNEFGFVVPAVAQKQEDGTYLLLDGHVRRELFKEGKMPVVVVDWPEDKQKRFMAAFDRVGWLAEEEEASLGRLLSSMNEEARVGLPAFGDNEVEKLLGGLDIPPVEDEPEDGQEVPDVPLYMTWRVTAPAVAGEKIVEFLTSLKGEYSDIRWKEF